jgi:PhnB protein
VPPATRYIFIYVEDVDKVIERAVSAGAHILLHLKNQFWCDRTARIMDISGHIWTIASHVEETSATDREERWDKILNRNQVK